MRKHFAMPVVAALAVAGACARTGSSGFPPPVRPGIMVPADASSTFRGLVRLMEARGFPVLVADTSFGTLRTDWVEWAAGENPLQGVADCDTTEDSPPSATRGRFGFEVRPRANRSFVTIIAHWQMDKHGGFDGSDRGYVDCRSTGAWERRMEENLLQRQVIR